MGFPLALWDQMETKGEAVSVRLSVHLSIHLGSVWGLHRARALRTTNTFIFCLKNWGKQDPSPACQG